MKPSTCKRLLGTVVGMALLLFLLRTFVATVYLVPSAGMEPGLREGSRVLVCRWSYGLRLPMLEWIGYHRWLSRPARRGDIVVFNHPARLDRPIDLREACVGRCTGAPGDTLWLDTTTVALAQADTAGTPSEAMASLPDAAASPSGATEPLSDTAEPLPEATGPSSEVLASLPDAAVSETDADMDTACAPARSLLSIVVPRRGQPVHVTPNNIYLLRNTLAMHEGRQAEVRRDTFPTADGQPMPRLTLVVDGQAASRVSFSQDYYWVSADHPACLTDSRLFGLVPHSHLIGRVGRIGR